MFCSFRSVECNTSTNPGVLHYLMLKPEYVIIMARVITTRNSLNTQYSHIFVTTTTTTITVLCVRIYKGKEDKIHDFRVFLNKYNNKKSCTYYALHKNYHVYYIPLQNILFFITSGPPEMASFYNVF